MSNGKEIKRNELPVPLRDMKIRIPKKHLRTLKTEEERKLYAIALFAFSLRDIAEFYKHYVYPSLGIPWGEKQEYIDILQAEINKCHEEMRETE